MLSPDKNFKSRSNNIFAEIYTAELSQLEHIRKTSNYSELLAHLKNYSDYLSECANNESANENIKKATNGSNIISLSTPSPEIIEKLQLAHLAACAILLEGLSYPLDQLNTQTILNAGKKFANSPQSAEPATRVNLLRRLHGVDAVRTIQLLRLLGLITNSPENMYQLGLGVATGNKDINYVHAEPKLQIELNAAGQLAHFKSVQHKVADIIISDLDEQYKKLYDTYEKDTDSSISCYISDTYDLLEALKERDIKYRNLITMLRIEPAMIPDSIEFLRRLTPIIDSSCDFVLSIGSGDNDDAYNQRVFVVSDLFKQLQIAGLEPVLVKLHDEGSVLNQIHSLKYGSSSTSSYEILYCKLDKPLLEKAYG
jgi:hypothetical protein